MLLKAICQECHIINLPDCGDFKIGYSRTEDIFSIEAQYYSLSSFFFLLFLD